MKSVFHLNPQDLDRFSTIAAFDRAEIDNPIDDPERVQYMDRLNTVLALVERWVPRGARVGDFGSAQANAALLLAERGWRTVALDRNVELLQYSQLKHETGQVSWLCADLECVPLAERSFDAVVMAEVVTVSYHPQRSIAGGMRMLRPGGIAIVSVPNGERIGLRLPQPGGGTAEMPSVHSTSRDFTYKVNITPGELREHVVEYGEIIEDGYCGGTVLWNRRTRIIARLLPGPAWGWGEHVLPRVAILRRWLARNYYVVVRKSAVTSQPA